MAVEVMDQEALLASVCRDEFEQFVREFWPEVPGAGVLVWNWHMSYLCETLQKIAQRVFTCQPREYDVIFNVSPGTSKSTICSILFPCWVWANMPTARILTASHTHELVLDLATKSREVIRGELFSRLYPHIVFSEAQDTKGYYRNTAGGDRLTCTVAGKSPMGFHAHFLIVDDPIDPKKAVSEAEIKNARDFMTNVLPTRKVDKTVSVTFLIMQRLHREDPTAVLLENSKKEDAPKVKHVCLPAELPKGSDGAYLPANISPLDLIPYYRDGLMDPVRLPRYGPGGLKEFRTTLGAYGYASQFEQSPIPLAGGMFKEHWFNQRCKAAPYHARRIRYWDRAATQDGGCYTAGVLMAFYEGNYYVEHVVHGQWEPDERNARMQATALRDRSRYGPRDEPPIYVEAEGGSSGRDAWKSVARALVGHVVKEDKVTGAKDARAEPWASQLAAGNVYLVDDATWDVAGYVQEHCLFRPDPTVKRLGKFKDQVDASSGAFNLLVASSRPPTLRTYSMGRRNKGEVRIVFTSRETLRNVLLEGRCLLVCFHEPQKEEVDHAKPAVMAGSETTVSGAGGHGTQGDPAATVGCVDNRVETPSGPYPHVINDLVGSLVLSFADLDPADLQERWGLPVEPYGTTPDKLVMRPEHGKKLWAFLLRQHSQPADTYVFCDWGCEIAHSVATAVSDLLRLQRNTLHSLDDPEKKWEEDAPNRHVYQVTKSSRGLVV